MMRPPCFSVSEHWHCGVESGSSADRAALLGILERLPGQLPDALGRHRCLPALWPRQGPITILHPEIRALEISDYHSYSAGGILRVNTFSEIDDAVVIDVPTLDDDSFVLLTGPRATRGCRWQRSWPAAPRYRCAVSSVGGTASARIRAFIDIP